MFIFGAEVLKSVLDKNKSEEMKKFPNSKKCDLCEYRFDRFYTLKKPLNTKHTE